MDYLDLKPKHIVYWAGTFFSGLPLDNKTLDNMQLEKQRDQLEKQRDKYLESIKSAYNNYFENLLESIKKEFNCIVKTEEDMKIATPRNIKDSNGIKVKYLSFPIICFDNFKVGVRINPCIADSLSKIWMYILHSSNSECDFSQTLTIFEKEKKIVERIQSLVSEKYLEVLKRDFSSINKIDYRVSLYGLGSDKWHQLKELYQEHLKNKDKKTLKEKWRPLFDYLVECSNKIDMPSNVCKLDENDYVWSVFDYLIFNSTKVRNQTAPNLVARYSDIVSGFTSFYCLVKTDNNGFNGLNLVKNTMRTVVLSFNNVM